MKQFTSFARFLVVLMAWLLFGMIPKGSADSVAADESYALLQTLQENLDMDKLAGLEMSLKEFTSLLSDSFALKGKDCPILIDVESFKREKGSNDDIFLDNVVRMPSHPKRMPAINALQIALSQSQLPATFLIKKGMVIITTKKQASTRELLKQTVTATFNDRPLSDALADLSAITGASIVVDGRLGEKTKKPVTALLKNDVSLDAALRMLTDMADLKVVILDSGIYVTSPANAQAMLKEVEKQRVPEKKQTKKSD